MINIQQGIKNKICKYTKKKKNIEQLNNWKVWHKVIQYQLEVSRKVVFYLNGFIMVLLTFPWL